MHAATALGYSPEAMEGPARPIMPWEKTGYMTVKKPGPKIATMKLLASEIARARQREAQATETKQAKR